MSHRDENGKQGTLLKTPVWVSVVTLLVLVALSVPLLLFLHQYHADLVKKEFLLQESRSLDEQIQKKMDIGDTVALAYARNSGIRNALLFEERAPIIQELKGINRLYARETRFDNIEAHIITADGRSLVKTFSLDSYNQNIMEHDLVNRAVRSGQATKGINIGGAANHFRVINIQPIHSPNDEQEVIGFIGISQGLKSVVNAFRKNGMDYTLFSPQLENGLDQKAFSVGRASYFEDSPLIKASLSKAQLKTQKLHVLANRMLFTQPIINRHGQILAAHGVSIPVEQLNEKVWQRNASAIYILLAILLSTVTVAVLLILVIKRSVIRPIAVFENTINKLLASKQYDTPVRIDSDNEIGRLSKQFNTLLLQTSELIESLKYQQAAINRTLILSRTDLDGVITEVNPQFERISGYRASELIGRTHSLIRHPDVPDEMYRELWRTIKAGQVWQGQIKNRRKDGSVYYVKAHILPIENRFGEVVEYLSIREDITQLVELKESLQTAKESAESANQAKSQFLSSMSHELRTPLNAIIGFSQLLQLSDLSDKQKGQLQNITQSGTHLLALINDILELAKIESGTMELDIRPVSLNELVQEALTMVEGVAREKKVVLSPFEEGEGNYWVQADYTRLKQVLLNFLSNAIKYNQSGGEVSVLAEPFSKAQRTWVGVHVRDTGMGIAQEQITRLFEPFNRLGHESSNIEGTGIGLSIARDLVEKMGGEIGVESREGEGSDFWFEFPVSHESAMSQS